MSSSMNHRKRSHRSEKRRLVCLSSMRQFATADGLGGRPAVNGETEVLSGWRKGTRKLYEGNEVSKHVGGWLKSTKKRNRKRADGAREGVPA